MPHLAVCVFIHPVRYLIIYWFAMEFQETGINVIVLLLYTYMAQIISV